MAADHLQFRESSTTAFFAGSHLVKSRVQYTHTASVYSLPFLIPMWSVKRYHVLSIFSKYSDVFSICSSKGTMGLGSIRHGPFKSFVRAMPIVLLIVPDGPP